MSNSSKASDQSKRAQFQQMVRNVKRAGLTRERLKERSAPLESDTSRPMAQFWNFVRAGLILGDQTRYFIIESFESPDITMLERTQIFEHSGWIKRPRTWREQLSVIPLDEPTYMKNVLPISDYNEEEHFSYEKVHIFNSHVIQNCFRKSTKNYTVSVERWPEGFYHYGNVTSPGVDKNWKLFFMPLSEHVRPYKNLSDCYSILVSRNMVGPGMVVTLDDVRIPGPKGIRFVPIDIALIVIDDALEINHSAVVDLLSLKPSKREKPGAPKKVNDIKPILLHLENQGERPASRLGTAKEIIRILKIKKPNFTISLSAVEKEISRLERYRFSEFFCGAPESYRAQTEEILIADLQSWLEKKYPGWKVQTRFLQRQIQKIRNGQQLSRR